MVSLFDVAREAGVSPATVSRVISGGAAVAVETRARVMSAVNHLGYRPNAIAQSLRRGRGRTIALVTGDIEQGIYAALAKEVQSRLAEIDLDLLLFDMAHSQERLTHLIERSASLGLRGVLLAAPRTMSMERLLPIVQTATEAGVAIVSLSQRLESHGIASIVPGDADGAVGAMRHLKERGRWPVAYLGRIETSAVGRQRFEGYRRALEEAGAPFDPDLAWDISKGDRSEAGYAALRRAMEKGLRFSAVLAASDEIALGGMAAALDLGRPVPEDIAFIGFGGVRWGQFTRPALTTLSLDVGELARAVASHFTALIEERECPLLTTVPLRLIVRGST